MDNEKNKSFYEIIKAMYEGCVRLRDTESTECIDYAMAEQGVKSDKYYPDVDYHKVFARTIAEAQRLAELAYSVGFDKYGRDLNGTWRGLESNARNKGLIPR